MVSHERVEEMLQEEIAKVKAIGIIVEPINPKIQFPKAKSFYGMCHHEVTRYNGKTYYCYIRISEYYLEAPESQIRGTLMHEVLHACKESGYGHGKEWQSLAKKVNDAYGYNIKRTGSQVLGEKEFSLRKSAPAAHTTIKHMCRCTKCGHCWYRTRHSNFTLHPEEYTCKCGGSIERVY